MSSDQSARTASNSATPAGGDASTASVARVYDAILGGEHNYEVDQDVAQSIFEVSPDARRTAQAIRQWLGRVVRWLSGPAGMDQFLDVGSGLPTAENTHEIAQRNNPGARVVYVDNDPLVSAHSDTLLGNNPNANVAEGDLTRPRELLRHPTVTGTLELDRPFVLIQSNTLHHPADEQRPHELMRTYIDALPSGSYVALCHFWDPADEAPELSEFAREVEHRFSTSSMGVGTVPYPCGDHLLLRRAGTGRTGSGGATRMVAGRAPDAGPDSDGPRLPRGSGAHAVTNACPSARNSSSTRSRAPNGESQCDQGRLVARLCGC